MAFTIAIMKKTKDSLSRNQTMPGTRVKGMMLSGGSQPPRNRMLINPHSIMMFMYSARKNIRNGPEEYSTKKPATSSLSASSRSNGGRWVSASDETKKITSMGNRMVKTFQCRKPTALVVSCACTIWEMFSEPANSSTVIITKPMETSYDTIWAAARSADRKAYLEFDAQPAITVP